jgi:stage II sporulation protein AA (anti-sigma F factor antagonist)
MQIAIQDEGSAATVTMTGRLDIAGSEVVALPLATLSGSKSTLFLDMAGVTFVASLGLRQLVSAAKTIGRRGGRLVLLNPSAVVTEVIELSGLSNLLSIGSTG